MIHKYISVQINNLPLGFFTGTNGVAVAVRVVPDEKSSRVW
jgi:hypothetical protein